MNRLADAGAVFELATMYVYDMMGVKNYIHMDSADSNQGRNRLTTMCVDVTVSFFF